MLVDNLRSGFPIGDMPRLEETVIIPNHQSCAEHSAVIDEYILGEISAGRMSGPFTRDRVELILGGPFFASPLIVAVQTQEPGTPDKLRVCRNLSKGTKFASSVNSHIAKESFPTRFDTAMRVADIVSRSPEHLVLGRVGHLVPRVS